MNKVDHITSGFGHEVSPEEAKAEFSKSIALLGRLHQKLHDLIHLVLTEAGFTDITSVQGLLLYNLGEHEIKVGELKTRGFYLGSNVSYNLKKLVKLGYVSQEQARHDRRSAQVSLTVKGHRVRKIVTDLFDDDIEKILTSCPLEFEEIQTSGKVLEVWDQFWAQQLGNPSRQD